MDPIRLVLNEGQDLQDRAFLLVKRDGSPATDGAAMPLLAEDLDTDGLEAMEKEALSSAVISASFRLNPELTEYELIAGPKVIDQLNDLIFYIRRIKGRTRERILKNLRILHRISLSDTSGLKHLIDAVIQDAGEAIESETVVSLNCEAVREETGFVLVEAPLDDQGDEMQVFECVDEEDTNH